MTHSMHTKALQLAGTQAILSQGNKPDRSTSVALSADDEEKGFGAASPRQLVFKVLRYFANRVNCESREEKKKTFSFKAAIKRVERKSADR